MYVAIVVDGTALPEVELLRMLPSKVLHEEVLAIEFVVLIRTPYASPDSKSHVPCLNVALPFVLGRESKYAAIRL